MNQRNIALLHLLKMRGIMLEKKVGKKHASVRCLTCTVLAYSILLHRVYPAIILHRVGVFYTPAPSYNLYISCTVLVYSILLHRVTSPHYLYICIQLYDDSLYIHIYIYTSPHYFYIYTHTHTNTNMSIYIYIYIT